MTKKLKLKIKELCNYLQIQDELLAIRVHNGSGGNDEYLLVKIEGDELHVSVVDELTDISMENLRLIMQRDEEGKFIVPDVEQAILDKEMDY